MNHYAAREHMVERQIASRGVRDARVLAAMRAVPRERFVEPGTEAHAYEDRPLPIGQGQTISQPYIVARMAEAARIDATDRVLEIGAGSGYAAAVLACLAQQVDTVERHASLAERARQTLAANGFGNVHVHVGDGTGGWPSQAPYDAIIVAAGAPHVADVLVQQLAIGGRLVIPVAEARSEQTLTLLTRTGKQSFSEENLGSVRFVPLIGALGWGDSDPESRQAQPEVEPTTLLIRELSQAAEPLPSLDDPEFGARFDRFSHCRVVLLGECTHGTSQFYRARAAITRRLLQRHGFSFVAIEADWPDAAQINRRIRGLPRDRAAQMPFERFPSWMWRNLETSQLVQWLVRYNVGRASEQQVGFYGLDLYNMHASIGSVLAYLESVDPIAANIARKRYGCLAPWQHDPARYGMATLENRYSSCEHEVVSQCRELLQRQLRQGDEAALDAAQSARLVASAEKYYRTMYYGGSESWNLRDSHMFSTLTQLLSAKGDASKAVVWAHNSHLGDPWHTAMGKVQGEHNIGQLCRQEFGDDAALIGFGTHAGTVAAAGQWGDAMEIMQINPSVPDSIEWLCHQTGVGSFLLDTATLSPTLQPELVKERLQRFIGVIYRPLTEMGSHYAQCSLGRQFDSYVWFDRTHAVTPLPAANLAVEPDLFPSGQ